MWLDHYYNFTIFQLKVTGVSGAHGNHVLLTVVTVYNTGAENVVILHQLMEAETVQETRELNRTPGSVMTTAQTEREPAQVVGAFQQLKNYYLLYYFLIGFWVQVQ